MLFRYEDPMGKTVRVNAEPYIVVGVTEHRTASAAVGGSLSGQDFNRRRWTFQDLLLVIRFTGLLEFLDDPVDFLI